MAEIILNMIVKNESKIIRRMLRSVLPIISGYCIVDTGSTDNTIEIIQDCLRTVKGEIHQEPFQNFGYNRTSAFEKACEMIRKWQTQENSFVLFLDADMVLETPCGIDEFKKLLTNPIVYSLCQHNSCLKYYNVRIVSATVKLQCVGKTHEYYQYSCHNTYLDDSKVYIRDIGDGGCKSDKFERDIRLLESEITDGTATERTYFYLANSYRDIGNASKAIENYAKRIAMKGWQEEVGNSLYHMGKLQMAQGNTDSGIVSLLTSYETTGRMEALYELTKHFRNNGNNRLAGLFCKPDLPCPADGLFVDKTVYNWKMYYEYTILAWYNKCPIDEMRYIDLFNFSDGSITENILYNYKWYCRKLVKDIGEIKVDAEDLHGFNTSTPCIMKMSNGKYLLNARCVNYQIMPNGTYNYEGKITTKNYYTILDEDFERSLANAKYTEAMPKWDAGCLYDGIEDIRTYQSGDDVLFSGTVERLDNPGSGELSVCIGNYWNPENFQQVMIPPFGSKYEKNWVFLHFDNATRMVYNWSPLRIINLDGTIYRQYNNVPAFFKLLRGSSNQTSNGYFMCHLVSNEKPKRHYYHVIVRIIPTDKGLELTWSNIFKFKGHEIEYCLGMIEMQDDFLVSYSYNDEKSYLGKIPKKELKWCNKYINEF